MSDLKTDMFGNSSIDFGKLHAQALAVDVGEHGQVEETGQADSVETPVETGIEPVALEAEQQVTQTQTHKLLDENGVIIAPDDAKIRVKIDGKEDVITVKEYRDAIQREASWTQKQQLFAEQRRQAQTELANQYAQIQQEARAVQLAQQQFNQANNPVNELLKRLEQAQQVETDPGQIATLGEVQKAIEDMKANFGKELVAREQATARAIQQSLAEQAQSMAIKQDGEKFNSALEPILASDEGALLRKINPYAEQVIRFQVAQMPANSIEESIKNLRTFVDEWVANVKSVNVTSQQQVAVKQAKQKMESNKGSAPSIQHGQKKEEFFNLKTGKLDWNALRKAAAGMMEG